MNPQTKKASITKYPNGKRGIKITFSFNFDDLDKVKSLSERKYHPEGKYWTTPLKMQTVESLKNWGFELDQELKDYLKKTKVHVDQVSEIEIPGLRKTLYPFQKRGVAFIEAKDGRVLIGDEMGLGKTMQALGWLQLHPELRPAIIVVPASLKLNWAKEAHTWMARPRIQILSGTNPSTKLKGELIIINYDILSNKYKTVINKKGKQVEVEIPYTGWIDFLLDYQPMILIIDEVHLIKTSKAKRTKAVMKLGRRIPHVLALSGTPIVNRPIEIYNTIKLIDPTIMPPRFEFAMKYCGAKNNGFGWDFSGATNTKELHEKLSNTIMIRRKKVDVLPDLPNKMRSYIPMELDNKEEYQFAEDNFIAFVRGRKGEEAAERASNAQALVEIGALKQLAVQGKMKQAIGWIQNFLDVGGKLVVFTVHKFVIDQLMDKFGDIAVKIDGSVTGINRSRSVSDFQTNSAIRLFVGNVKAAGVGITLTASSNVAFLELPWTPGEVVQAEDRVHRIGQSNNVCIHYLLAAGTIEEKIASLIDRKRKILDAVLDGKDTEDQSLLSELMKEYE